MPDLSQYDGTATTESTLREEYNRNKPRLPGNPVNAPQKRRPTREELMAMAKSAKWRDQTQGQFLASVSAAYGPEVAAEVSSLGVWGEPAQAPAPRSTYAEQAPRQASPAPSTQQPQGWITGKKEDLGPAFKEVPRPVSQMAEPARPAPAQEDAPQSGYADPKNSSGYLMAQASALESQGKLAEALESYIKADAAVNAGTASKSTSDLSKRLQARIAELQSAMATQKAQAPAGRPGGR